jgi:hypothetical protein
MAKIAASPDSDKVSANVESALTKSFAGAANIAERYPQYARPILSAAKTSFLQGDRWAYAAGLAAIALGAALVFFAFPKKEREQELLAEYRAEDEAGSAPDRQT